MNDEKTVLINALIRHKSELQSIFNRNSSRIFKSAEASTRARNDGNKRFIRKDHDAQTHREIFSYYAKSIALAPSDSEELALAYGNKSAFLFHIGLYKECLGDIEKACRITRNNNLKVKLLCRKVECLKKLGITKYQSTLDAAQNSLNKIDESDKDKSHLVDRLNKVEVLPVTEEDQIEQEHHKNEIVNTLCSRDEILKSIQIEFSQKFGRHLVAAKDFNVGDIIFTEKLYTATVQENKCYTNCHHCLKNCWSIVPCNQCSLAIYCSENCQQKAWESYHDVECSIVPHFANNDFFNFFHICLRMLVIGLKEAGGVSQLKSDLLLVDKCTDKSLKGFLKDGKFTSNSIQSIYSLSLDNSISDHSMSIVTRNVISVLIFLAKCNSLIKSCCLEKVEDILNNEDLIFLGSVLIKLYKITSNNGFVLSNLVHICELSMPIDTCVANKCCARGTGLAPLLSLTNHSCFPNAERCFSEDQKVVVYAVQPIKKNSQIFISYNTSYYHIPLESRQDLLKKYDFICDCQACIELWPTATVMPIEISKEQTSSQIILEMNLYKDSKHIFESIQSKSKSFDKNDVKKLSQACSKALKNLKQPSMLVCYLTEALRNVFSAMYGFKLQSFMQCQDKNQ